MSTPANATTADKLLALAKDLAVDYPTQNVAVALVSSALVQVEMTIGKADEAIANLQQNLQKVQEQRLGLLANKNMLTELKTTFQEVEKTIAANVKTAPEPVIEATPAPRPTVITV